MATRVDNSAHERAERRKYCGTCGCHYHNRFNPERGWPECPHNPERGWPECPHYHVNIVELHDEEAVLAHRAKRVLAAKFAPKKEHA